MGDGFIDVHNHSLYGVDDGALTIDDSINMINKAVQDGTTAIVLTPHCYGGSHHVDSSIIKEHFNKLSSVVQDNGIKVDLYLGNEIMYGENTIEYLKSGQALCYPDSKHILVEFYPDSPDNVIINAVKNIRSAGYIPVIAHVERYSFTANDIDNIKTLRNLGAYIAVNADNLNQSVFSKSRKLVTKLLKLRLVDFVTSDAHDTIKYPPELKRAYKEISIITDQEYADKLFKINASLLINNN